MKNDLRSRFKKYVIDGNHLVYNATNGTKTYILMYQRLKQIPSVPKTKQSSRKKKDSE